MSIRRNNSTIKQDHRINILLLQYYLSMGNICRLFTIITANIVLIIIHRVELLFNCYFLVKSSKLFYKINSIKVSFDHVVGKRWLVPPFIFLRVWILFC